MDGQEGWIHRENNFVSHSLQVTSTGQVRSVKSIMNRARIFKLETFRFEDEYEYVYEILSVLFSGARTWAR